MIISVKNSHEIGSIQDIKLKIFDNSNSDNEYQPGKFIRKSNVEEFLNYWQIHAPEELKKFIEKYGPPPTEYFYYEVITD